MFCGPIIPEHVRRWNDLCRAWAERPDLPPLPTGERLELCHRIFDAEERELGTDFSPLAIDGAPAGMTFMELFQRSAGRFRWQELADQEADRVIEELWRDNPPGDSKPTT